jgi:ketosteroid isomerase-like protein
MPTLHPYKQLLTTTFPLDPVPRSEVEAYLARFFEVSQKLDATADPERMDWDAWRDLRHPDYFIQWNIHQGRFRISREEYIERWKWTIRQGRGWEKLDAQVHIIDTGFIVEGLLRSTHVGVDGKPFIFPLCETYHIRDGKAVYSNEYIDPTDLRPIDGEIPGGW